MRQKKMREKMSPVVIKRKSSLVNVVQICPFLDVEKR